MRVHIFPADDGGCGSYRMLWPGKAVEALGYDIRVFNYDDDDAHVAMMLQEDAHGVPHVRGVADPGCDVVVFQRPLRRLVATAIPYLQSRGIKVVVEVDDDFHAIHPRNAAFKHSLGKTSDGEAHRDNLLMACRLADRVTVSTPALLGRYGSGHGVLLPNYVPAWYLDIPKIFSTPNRLGWSGSLVSHPNDLQQMGAAFPEVVRKTGSEVWVVGDGNRVARVTGLGPSVPVQTSGWVPIQDYPFRMSEIDVGVVPLESTVFNEAKSWLKGLEFASLGIPFVASPTQQYSDLFHIYGIGLLEADRRKWGKTLSATIGSREHLGEMFRSAVRKHGLTIEDHANDWAEAWFKW